MVNLVSSKASAEYMEFVKNLRRNRVKADTDEEMISYWRAMDTIVKYFKDNNDRYLELVNVENITNGS